MKRLLVTVLGVLTDGRVLCLLASLICVSYAVQAGKTVSWDVLHYHVYSGFSAVHDRFAQDFLPAGPQSYLNPYALAPFYAMNAAGWSPLLQSAVLAFFHALNIWVVYGLIRTMLPEDATLVRRLAQGVAWVLTLANPVYLSELGTSYVDVTTTLPVLLGVWALALGVTRDRLMLAVASGGAVGIATALKMSNATYALALGIGWLLVSGSVGARARRGVAFGLAALAGVLLAGGHWAWQLWTTFGNPVFPSFNGFFQSPDYPSQAGGLAIRFMPASLWDALTLPFRMVVPQPLIYVENTQPEARFAAFAVVLVCMVALFFWRRGRFGAEAADPTVDGAVRTTRLMTMVAVMSWSLWMASSGNGRYLLPLSLWIGALVTALWWHTTGGGRWFWYGVLPLLGVQLVQLHFAIEDGRWDRQPVWGPTWVPLEVPEVLRSDPNLYMSVSMSSHSFILPWVHPASGMVSVGGQLPLSPSSSGAGRVNELLVRYAGRVRLLTATTDAINGQSVLSSLIPISAVETAARWGYAVDGSTCEVITVHVETNEVWLRNMFATIRAAMNQQKLKSPARQDRFELLACVLKADPAARVRYERELAPVDAVLDQLEDLCPVMLRPRRTVTERLNAGTWTRSYGATDALTFVRSGRVSYSPSLSNKKELNAGRIEDWQQGIRPALQCH